jgi:hypothetical protein
MLADEYEFYKKGSGRGKWASIYYDSQNKKILRERLLPRFPYCVQRWERLSGTQYDISPPALTELADARGMQVLARVLLRRERRRSIHRSATQGARLARSTTMAELPGSRPT